ncbi:hypothetical protein RUND412_004043 [Rhizina undulata]
MDWERGFKARTIPATEWEGYRELFEGLYVHEDHSLAEVRKTLATKYNFYANEAQYKKKITKWGLEKTLTKKKKAMLRMRDTGASKGRITSSAFNRWPTNLGNTIILPTACDHVEDGFTDLIIYKFIGTTHFSECESARFSDMSTFGDFGCDNGGSASGAVGIDIIPTSVVLEENSDIPKPSYSGDGGLDDTFSLTEARTELAKLFDNLQKPGPCEPHSIMPNEEPSEADFEKTLELFKQTLTEWEKFLGVKHFFTLEVASNIATALYYHGMYRNALEFYHRARVGYENAFGVDYPLTLDTMHSIAMVHDMQREYSEALKWYLRALEGKRKALGKRDLSTLSTLNNIVMVHLAQGLSEVPPSLGVFIGTEDLSGDCYPSTLNSIDNKAFDQQRCHDDMIRFYKLALEKSETELGEDHYLTLQTATVIAVILEKQDYNEAIELYRRASAGWKKTGGNTIEWIEMRIEILSKKLVASKDISALGRYIENAKDSEEDKSLNIRYRSGRLTLPKLSMEFSSRILEHPLVRMRSFRKM